MSSGQISDDRVEWGGANRGTRQLKRIRFHSNIPLRMGGVAFIRLPV